MKERSVFNERNKGHITGQYPIFFGDSLGVGDTINITHKRIDDLKELQRAFFWSPTEINLEQDRQDLLTVDPVAADLMTKTILWQSMQDSIVGRSIASMLAPHVTNTEAETMILEWARIESIHMEAYLHIVKQVFPNPSQIMKDIYNNVEVKNRSEKIIKIFDDLYNMHHSEDIEAKKRKMALGLATLLILEGTSFMSSFAVTWSVAEAVDGFAGIAETVSLISRDEQIHSVMSYELIKACKESDGWEYVFEDIQEDIRQVLDDVVRGELNWNKYLFSGERKDGILGLTKELLDNTVLFFANTAYKMLGIPNPYKIVEELPLPVVDKYLDRSLIQTANQEIQTGNYVIGQVVNDITKTTNLNFESGIFSIK